MLMENCDGSFYVGSMLHLSTRQIQKIKKIKQSQKKKKFKSTYFAFQNYPVNFTFLPRVLTYSYKQF